MNRFLRLFVILALLGVVAASCHTSSPDPAVPEPNAEVVSADIYTEAGDAEMQEYLDGGTTPDDRLLQSIMQFRELYRVESEFGKPDWAEARLFRYEDVDFVMVPIVSIRPGEFHCLVASPAEDDLLIFVMSAEAGPVIPEEDAVALNDTDDAPLLAGSMTFVHGPDLDDCLFVKIDDSSVDRLSSASSRARCVWRCFKRYYSSKEISRCVSLAKACLAIPYPFNVPVCLAAAYCIYNYYRHHLGPLIRCVCQCFGWHTHALRPTKQ